MSFNIDSDSTRAARCAVTAARVVVDAVKPMHADAMPQAIVRRSAPTIANVQLVTIRLLIAQCIAPGTRVYTDEYDIYHRLPEWGFDHHTGCHRRGEYARDDDGDGFHEVHVNTAEGFWSLLRSWLRSHRGIPQEKLPLHLGFFQFVHNARIRGKGLLRPLLELLVA